MPLLVGLMEFDDDRQIRRAKAVGVGGGLKGDS